jgi:hypothetical protein
VCGQVRACLGGGTGLSTYVPNAGALLQARTQRHTVTACGTPGTALNRGLLGP